MPRKSCSSFATLLTLSTRQTDRHRTADHIWLWFASRFADMIQSMVAQSSSLERVFRPAEGGLPEPLARYLLSLDFASEDKARYEELSYKSQESSLSPSEAEELDDLLTTNDVLAILQSKARASLKTKPSQF